MLCKRSRGLRNPPEHWVCPMAYLRIPRLEVRTERRGEKGNNVCGRSSTVEYRLSKPDVEGSIPFARSGVDRGSCLTCLSLYPQPRFFMLVLFTVP